MSYHGFPPYVSVAKRRENARRKINKLRKKGLDIQPVEIEKRKITTTFWGNSWCTHIESFSDYSNRLPRGKTYVRNGSVCHLSIEEGSINAMVSGSSIYNVNIEIASLSNEKWQEIKNNCSGKIDSLLDLLSGQLSEGVMQTVCNQASGLFPLTHEIKLSCTCPDWATMCKHVAAALYGVGARLDYSPEKLFELRGVNHNELVDISTAVINSITGSESEQPQIDHDDLSSLFGIDLSGTKPVSDAKDTLNIGDKTSSNKSTQTKNNKPNKTKISKPPKYLSGSSIRKKRTQLKLSQKEFAEKIGVSATTISNWERKGKYKVNLSKNKIKVLHELF